MAFGLAAFILYLWFFVGFDGLFTLISKLNAMQYTVFFSLAVAALLLAVVFDSLIWHSLLVSLSVKTRFKKIMLYNWIGNFVELIIPSATVGGEVARIALAQKETNHDAGIAAATVLSSRIVSTFVYSGGLFVSFLTLLLSRQLPVFLVMPVALVAAGTASVLAVVFVVAFKASAVEKIVGVSMWVTRRIVKNQEHRQAIEAKVRHALTSFSEVFKTFKANPKYLIKPFIFAITAWMLSLTVYLMIFYALGFTAISLVDLATIYSIVTTVETVTAGFPVGAVEVTMVSLFSLYGVPLAVAGAATTLTRLLTFWCQIIVGYPLVEWLGAKSLLKGGLQNPVVFPKPIAIEKP